MKSKAKDLRAALPRAIAYFLATAMALACIGRILFHDAVLPLIWINSFTPFLYLPAYPLALFALWSRHLRLALLSALLVLCHIAWVGPDFLPASSGGQDATTSQPIRVFSANVVSRDALPIVIGRIRETDPDLVLLQEYTHSWRDAMERSGLLKTYSHQETLTREGSFGIGVFSKWPLEEIQLIQVQVVSAIRATVVTDRGRFCLYHVQGPSPRFFHSVRRIDAYWTEIEKRLQQEKGPRLIAGDFNFTQHSRWYRRLLSTGLHSAHRDQGRGYATTWPNDTWWFVPPIRIDHALLAGGIRCVGIWEDEGHISDHKPLVFDFFLEGVEGHR